MSMYNMLFGVNKIAPVLLRVLDIDQVDSVYQSGRFRDIYLNETGEEITLYTRNGGGNREAYDSEIQRLQSHPQYIEDYDDDFDCTYAYFKFRVPAEYLDLCRSLATGESPETVHEKFAKAIEHLTKAQDETT